MACVWGGGGGGTGGAPGGGVCGGGGEWGCQAGLCPLAESFPSPVDLMQNKN